VAVLFTLLVLVVGYHYAHSLPSEKVNLKRSAGWETYVYLGFHGLRFLISALLIALVLWLPSCLAFGFLDWISGWHTRAFFQKLVTYTLFDNIQLYHIIVALFAWGICQSEIGKKIGQGNKLVFENIKNYDGLLRLVIEAAAGQKPLRLSLKSRKVYVGLVTEEQFEAGDLDYVLIIPLLSGYRDKDKLDIFFDCSYISVYEKYGLLLPDGSELSEDSLLKIDDFRLAVKVGEIESASFFEFDVFGEFERYKKPSDEDAAAPENTKG
jgi:hypothetical protein